MADIIDAVQLDTPGSELIDLFEIELPASTLYFYPGLDENQDPIDFAARDGLSTNTYLAIPIDISGIEHTSDGALARPVLTVANIVGAVTGSNETTLYDELAALNEISNEFFLGKRLVRRRTFKEHLGAHTGTPPEEMPIVSYIIDRIASENNVLVSFELASPLDVEGVTFPNRVVVGKYCSWQYQGHFSTPSIGGCNWKLNNLVVASDETVGGCNLHNVYYDQYDRPCISLAFAQAEDVPYSLPHSKDELVLHGGNYWRSNVDSNSTTPAIGNPDWQIHVTFTDYNSGSTYNYTAPPVYQVYKHSSKLWTPKRHVPTGEAPFEGSYYWKRVDLCGKTINSCKLRFQFVPVDVSDEGNNTRPSVELNTDHPLPFGGFPGAEKFR